jgi:predicted CXXCH cytochrome family protein
MKARGNGTTRHATVLIRPRRFYLSIVALGAVTLGAGTLGAVAVLVAIRGREPDKSADRTDTPQAAPAVRGFASTAEATYVGMAACTECHSEQARTYAQTAHSLALADVEAAREPADAVFYHGVSGRTYTVYRHGEQLRHREAVVDEAGDEIAASDYPVRYLIGSGRHTRSYLVEIDGFLCESPLTWYASRGSWGVSPGYDGPNPPGFERAAEATCLFCHVGQLADGYRGYQRVQVVEQAIGCERCHGPGSLHVAEKREPAGPSSARPTIVNPARLSRDLSEAVCAQCHLNTDAMALVRGRELADFRPGLPLVEFCVNYQPSDIDSQTSQMTVVGHVEQMRLSRCYTESGTLTCTTCHDPHGERSTEPSQTQARFTEVCLNCHADRGCRLALDVRLHHASANNCVTCHMPQVDTEIRHIAFTHHRIGIHDEQPHRDLAGVPGSHPPASASQFTPGVADLVPLDLPPQMSETDRERNLGLAYFSLSQKQLDRVLSAAYRERARRLLENVRARGAGKREVAAALVRLYRESNPDAALQLAREALNSGRLAMKSRINCLFFLGELGVGRGLPSLAGPALEQLTRIRLLSEDWRLLGLCREEVADLRGAQAALQRAAELAPLRPQIRAELAEVYERIGLREDSRRERDISDRLVGQGRRER